jgi:hypothetical protein
MSFPVIGVKRDTHGTHMTIIKVLRINLTSKRQDMGNQLFYGLPDPACPGSSLSRRRARLRTGHLARL